MPNRRCDCSCDTQRHVHELIGNVRLAELNENPHIHQFAGISGQAIPIKGGNHIHEINIKTDFYEDHFHAIVGRSGPAIPVGGGRHIHFTTAQTSVDSNHNHDFIAASLIENPIGD